MPSPSSTVFSQFLHIQYLVRIDILCAVIFNFAHLKYCSVERPALGCKLSSGQFSFKFQVQAQSGRQCGQWIVRCAVRRPQTQVRWQNSVVSGILKLKLNVSVSFEKSSDWILSWDKGNSFENWNGFDPDWVVGQGSVFLLARKRDICSKSGPSVSGKNISYLFTLFTVAESVDVNIWVSITM